MEATPMLNKQKLFPPRGYDFCIIGFELKDIQLISHTMQQIFPGLLWPTGGRRRTVVPPEALRGAKCIAIRNSHTTLKYATSTHYFGRPSKVYNWNELKPLLDIQDIRKELTS